MSRQRVSVEMMSFPEIQTDNEHFYSVRLSRGFVQSTELLLRQHSEVSTNKENKAKDIHSPSKKTEYK